MGTLRRHVDRFGLADGGRLFRSGKGNVVAASTYSRVWKAARELALTPMQVASPLAARPYDLRHAAVSLWLNCGVPATDVAARAGHHVGVLLKVYAKRIDGQEATVNQRIEDALGRVNSPWTATNGGSGWHSAAQVDRSTRKRIRWSDDVFSDL
ncbi:hypothetical protein [Micromonospora rubida]